MTALGAATTARLRWTGHPLVDHGIAALTALARKRDPAEVTDADLDAVVEKAVESYLDSDLTKTLGVLFTINGFLNPSIKDANRRRERIREAVGAFRQPGDPALGPCSYCGRPGLRVLHRDDVPMLSGRDVVNFYPAGRPGLLLCGVCQTSLHGLVFGAPRCSGRALVIGADDKRLLLAIVKKWVNAGQTYLSLEGQGREAPKISRPRTRLVEALLAAQAEAQAAGELDELDTGLVAYGLSNSGQGPDVEIYELPSNAIGFLRKARAQRTAEAWRGIERQAWERVGRTGSAADASEGDRLQYQNYLYEDLFRLPDEARRFIRLYFLRNAAGLVRAGDPRSDYGSVADARLVSWDLTKLFLQEVLSMEQARIDAIRTLGDRIADEVIADNDRRLFQRAYRAREYWVVRRLLLDANFRRLNRSEAPVLGLDQYLAVFEEGEELARVDWRLAWDLVLIRLIEQLYESGWLQQHKDALADAAQEEEVALAESGV